MCVCWGQSGPMHSACHTHHGAAVQPTALSLLLPSSHPASQDVCRDMPHAFWSAECGVARVAMKIWRRTLAGRGLMRYTLTLYYVVCEWLVSTKSGHCWAVVPRYKHASAPGRYETPCAIPWYPGWRLFAR